MYEVFAIVVPSGTAVVGFVLARDKPEAMARLYDLSAPFIVGDLTSIVLRRTQASVNEGLLFQ